MTTRLLIIPGFLAFAAACSANSFVFNTPPGATLSGGPVSASATVTTGNGSVTVQLWDLLANPVDAAQLLSGFEFALDASTTATLTGSSGQEVNIAGGTGSLGSVVSTGWGFGSYQSAWLVCVICPGGLAQAPTAQPAHTIIGPGPYTDANGSINNNDPHNPFLNQTASFTILAPDVTTSTDVSNAIFYFSTTFGNGVPGGAVPEPGTMALIGAGFVAIFFARAARRTHR